MADSLLMGAALGTVASPSCLAWSTLDNHSSGAKDWTLGPFRRVSGANPCLIPNPSSAFMCPIRKEEVHWESKDVICAAAVVRDDKVCMLYRAEDRVGGLAGQAGQGWGTSRIGLAFSEDGLHFSRHPSPVLYPKNDFMKRYEWEGGCQDPRVVEGEDGRYYMTYTAFDGRSARLAVASSPDLIHWTKHGLAFDKAYGGKYRDLWTKSGAIVARRVGSQFVAARINGRYWMYYLGGQLQEGVHNPPIYVATSSNLIDWDPLRRADGDLRYAFGPRKGFFDSELTESGPFGLLTNKGILFIYNSAHRMSQTDPTNHKLAFVAGQALLDARDPSRLVDRTTHDFFHPELEWELRGHPGQYPNVVFLESLVFFQHRWLIYYGAADSQIGVAEFHP